MPFVLKLTEHTGSSLEWSLQVTLCWPVEDVDRNWLGLDQVFESHESLDEERLGVFHVAVEERHHEDTHVNTTNEFGGLCQVIVANSCGNQSSAVRALYKTCQLHTTWKQIRLTIGLLGSTLHDTYEQE